FGRFPRADLRRGGAATSRQHRQRLERRSCSAIMVEQRAEGAWADILTPGEAKPIESRCSSVKRMGSLPSLTLTPQEVRKTKQLQTGWRPVPVCPIVGFKMEPNAHVAKHAAKPHSPVGRRDYNRAGVSCALLHRGGVFASS